MQCTLSTCLACYACPFGAAQQSSRVARLVCRQSSPLCRALELSSDSHLAKRPRVALHSSTVRAGEAAAATEARHERAPVYMVSYNACAGSLLQKTCAQCHSCVSALPAFGNSPAPKTRLAVILPSSPLECRRMSWVSTALRPSPDGGEFVRCRYFKLRLFKRRLRRGSQAALKQGPATVRLRLLRKTLLGCRWRSS